MVIVAAIAFAAPLVFGFMPKLRLPAVVLEILLGIAVGPSGFGWTRSDTPVRSCEARDAIAVARCRARAPLLAPA